MNASLKTITALVWGVHLFLFLLLAFPSWSFMPAFTAIGRLHFLWVHIPIGALLIIAIADISGVRQRTTPAQRVLLFNVVLLASVTSVVTGIILGTEKVYNQWYESAHFGTALAFHAALAMLVITERKSTWNRVLVWLAVLFLLFTTHYGTMMAHGDQTVLAPINK